MAEHNTIRVYQATPVEHEALAAAAMVPGNLVKFDSTGKFALRVAADAGRPLLVATEADTLGKGVEDAYTTNDRVHAACFRSGDIALVMLADGANVAMGDMLELAAAGEVTKYASGTRVGQAMESLNLSASGVEANRRIKMLVS